MNKYVKNLNRIEFLVTLACTGHCKHCSEGDHAGFTEHLDGTCAAKAVDEICRVYKIDSLMVFGGEPLLYPEDVCKIFEAGKKAGIRRRDLITNGYFSKDEKLIQEVAEQLAKNGLNRLLLSVDAFHQETIPVGPVKQNCLPHGLSVKTITILTTSRHGKSSSCLQMSDLAWEPVMSSGRKETRGFILKTILICQKKLSIPMKTIQEMSDPFPSNPMEQSCREIFIKTALSIY